MKTIQSYCIPQRIKIQMACFPCMTADVSAASPAGSHFRVVGFTNDAEALHQPWPISMRWFSGYINLTALDCTGLTHLAGVGSGWLSTSLTAMDCRGLTHVATVGDDWLRGCTSLTAINCTGLTHLTAVGNGWFFDCTSLTEMDCSELTKLATVGDNWLCRCNCLTALDCKGLTQTCFGQRLLAAQLRQFNDARSHPAHAAAYGRRRVVGGVH